MIILIFININANYNKKLLHISSTSNIFKKPQALVNLTTNYTCNIHNELLWENNKSYEPWHQFQTLKI